jgi:hypothetical protein
MVICEPDFNIEFPTVSNVLKSEIHINLMRMCDKRKLFFTYCPQEVLSSEGEPV